MMEITQALQRIAQIARRCPTPTLKKAYVDAARDFCGQSRWLRTDITVSVVANDFDYTLTPADTDTEVIGVRKVVGTTSAGKEWRLNPLDKDQWPLNVRPDQPRFYAYVPEGQIDLQATPDASYTLTVTAQVQLVLGATTVPDVLDSKWGRALADGTLGYLMDIPEQPWTDHGQAMVRRKAFQAAINNAKADEQRGYNQGSVMVRQRAFITPRYW
jgi:hypothetical protein